MKSTRMVMGWILLTFAGWAQSSNGRAPYDPNHLYSPGQLREDLRYLKKQLEANHPALYRYTEKAAFQKYFDSLGLLLTHAMTAQQFLSLIELLNSKICDGHTMFLPGKTWTQYDNTKGIFLPLTVHYVEGFFQVIENNSDDPDIQQGTRILEINGMPASQIMSELVVRQIRDGKNKTYPEWIIDRYFSAYYSFVFGQPEKFSLKVLRGNDAATIDLVALTKARIRGNEGKNKWKRGGNSGLSLSIGSRSEQDTAEIFIPTLDPDKLQSEYHQGFKRTIDSFFSILAKKKVTSLLLDLRDNQGGDFESGRFLLSYLVAHPFRYLTGGPESRVIYPRKKHFSGNLLVYINGGSFSSTAIVAACLKDQRRTFFIGEETGGNRVVLSGNPIERSLPNTQISCFISTTNYRISNKENDGHGVIPDQPAYRTSLRATL